MWESGEEPPQFIAPQSVPAEAPERNTWICRRKLPFNTVTGKAFRVCSTCSTGAGSRYLRSLRATAKNGRRRRPGKSRSAATNARRSGGRTQPSSISRAKRNWHLASGEWTSLKNASYDVIRDFTPLVMLDETMSCVVAPGKLKYLEVISNKRYP
jgi:hypothetical protein